MLISQDFKEFLELLNAHKVRYIVVGGYAVNFHGYPRFTKDLDLWIWMEEDNLKGLINSIEDFGLSALQLKITDFFSTEAIIQLGYEPNRIDMMMDVDGLKFEPTYKRINRIVLDGVTVPFLNVEDLIKTKETVGRLQDLADVEQLRKIVTEEE